MTTAVVYANSAAVSSVAMTDRSSSAETINIEFDLSWENSWKNNTNHDAVWIFIKYSTDSGSTWNHATLSASGTNPSGFSTGSGSAVEIIVPSDKVGAFVRRSENGVGDIAVSDLSLVWDYGSDGLSATDSARVKVFAVEMVYIPSGAFKAGDTASTASLKQGSSDSDPWSVISSSAISVSGSVSNGFYYVSAGNSGESSTGSSFSIPSSFANGYQAFYVMKHEITEGAWVDFFNTLGASAKLNRDITSATGKNSDGSVARNTVSWITGNATTSRDDRACSFLSWMDGAAYADWAGLRPFTELEYEKMSRGVSVEPNANEYVWGTTSVTQATSISGSEDGTETVSTTDANAVYGSAGYAGGDGSSGPLRAGIFATDTSTRSDAGAGFYGVLELSGNLSERAVTVGNADGRSFQASHGDGELSSASSYEGNATNSDWPGIDSDSARGITGASGSGIRGGSWSDTSDKLQTSDRSQAALTDSSRASNYGFRAARTAP